MATPNSRAALAGLLALALCTCSPAAEFYKPGKWQEIRDQRLQPHGKVISSLDFSPTGTHLASGSYDNTIWVMRVPDGDFRTKRIEFIHRITGQPRPVGFLTFAGGGERIASNAGPGAVQIWDTTDGSKVGPPIKVAAEGPVALSPDGQILAFGAGFPADFDSGEDANNGQIYLVRVSDRKTVRTLSGHARYVTSLAFSPDGKWLASSGVGDQMIRLWSASEGRLLHEAPYRQRESLVFSPDGELIAGGVRQSGGVAILRTPELISMHQINWNPIVESAFSPDGKLLVLCSWSDLVGAPSLHLVRVADGNVLQTLVDEEPTAMSVAFHPDGDILAAGMSDGSIRFFSPSAD